MNLLEKNTQVNFKTNRDLLEKAKMIVAAQNLDMTASFNLFLENIVENKALPFETEKDRERAQLLEELRSEIKSSFDDLENGRFYTTKEVKDYLGI